jgi:hypothetical protein
MLIQRKPLRTAERRMRLCVVIPLGGGAKAQYPINNETEARHIYEEYLRMNPQLVPVLFNRNIS